MSPTGAATPSRLAAPLLWISVALCVATMLAAYVSIGIHVGSPWPWLALVHEAGDRTLLGTLFYFEHAARELPLDLVLMVAIAASARFALGSAGPADQEVRRRRRNGLALGTGICVTVIVVGTLATVGFGSLIDNLTQMHTRPGEALSWGAHWRYHLLSRAVLILVSMGLVGAILRLEVGADARGDALGARASLAALGAFVVLTLIFAPDLDPFRDPVFIGHQVREVLTHALVSVPAGFAVCLWLSGPRPPLGRSAGVSWASMGIAGVVGCAIGLYLLVAGLGMESASQGQTDSLVLLVSPHFFEHGFSYVVIALGAGALYEGFALRAPSTSPELPASHR